MNLTTLLDIPPINQLPEWAWVVLALLQFAATVVAVSILRRTIQAERKMAAQLLVAAERLEEAHKLVRMVTGVDIRDLRAKHEQDTNRTRRVDRRESGQ